VSLSTAVPIEASLRAAIFRSISSGTGKTAFGRPFACPRSQRTLKAWLAKLHVHDHGRMALGRGQVDQAAFAEKMDALPVPQGVFVDELADPPLAAREGLEGGDVDLDVEVPGVGDDRAVLHPQQVLLADDALVPGHGQEDVPERRRPRHGHDLKTVHDRLDGPDGIDFRDDHVGPGAAGPHGHALAAHAVAGHDELEAGEQDIGGPEDAVEGALARAVAVVEQVLRLGVVDGDDGVAEDPVLAMLFKRMTPVVVSSVPPRMPGRRSFRWSA